MAILPPGCVDEEANSSTVDVGRCGDERCIASNKKSLHKCSENYCCRSVEVINVLIRCITGFSFNITRKAKCGCGRCSPKTTTVKGIATGGPNSIPFKYGYINHAGKYLTQTGRNGDFSFTMSGDATRIVLNFKGKDRYNDFQDLTKVVSVVPGRQIFVEVKMKIRSKPVLVNTSETIEIPMGYSNNSDGQSNAAPVILSLPPHSLAKESGEIYNGTANLEVSFADPRNASQVQEADGDFMAISEEGDEQSLETFGVLKIDFTDSNGKPLQANTDIDVMLDVDEYNITEKEAEKIKLWYMDEKTGRWRIMDSGLKQHESRRSKRSGRKFYFGKIDNTRFNSLINLDKLGNVCVVKLLVGNQTADPESVTITITSNQGGLNRYREYSIPTGTSKCIATFCNSLTIQAKINQKILKPNDRNIATVLKGSRDVNYYIQKDEFDRFSNRITIRDISNPTNTDGPFFRPGGSCNQSPNENCLIFDNPRRQARAISSDDSIKWHSEEEISVCYVKITTQNSCSARRNVMFHVKSTNVSSLPNFEEGFTIVSTSSSSRSICAEFKCPPTNTRDILVTVTPLIGGTFKMTDDFKEEHSDFLLFEGEVASFRPIPGLNKEAIGVCFKKAIDGFIYNVEERAKEFHNNLKEYCERDLTPGLSFVCA